MEYKKVENTEEALRKLPPGTVIRNDGGEVYERLLARENSWGLTGISGYHRAELLMPTDNREAEFKSLPPQERGKVWMMGESKARQKNRSRTLPGLAAAMANQWG